MQRTRSLAGLKKIGPCRPGELADHLEVEAAALGYHLKKLLDAGPLAAITPSETHIQELRRKRFDKKPRRARREHQGRSASCSRSSCGRRFGGEGKFEIVAGERRWLAAKLAGPEGDHATCASSPTSRCSRCS
jgi:hypothetical protein